MVVATPHHIDLPVIATTTVAVAATSRNLLVDGLGGGFFHHLPRLQVEVQVVAAVEALELVGADPGLTVTTVVLEHRLGRRWRREVGRAAVRALGELLAVLLGQELGHAQGRLARLAVVTGALDLFGHARHPVNAHDGECVVFGATRAGDFAPLVVGLEILRDVTVCPAGLEIEPEVLLVQLAVHTLLDEDRQVGVVLDGGRIGRVLEGQEAHHGVPQVASALVVGISEHQEPGIVLAVTHLVLVLGILSLGQKILVDRQRPLQVHSSEDVEGTKRLGHGLETLEKLAALGHELVAVVPDVDLDQLLHGHPFELVRDELSIVRRVDDDRNSLTLHRQAMQDGEADHELATTQLLLILGEIVIDQG